MDINVVILFLESKLDCQLWEDLQADYKSVKKLCQDIRKEMEILVFPGTGENLHIL